MEQNLERALFAMRWLLAPLYLGLGLLLILFSVQFARELIHIVERTTTIAEVKIKVAASIVAISAIHLLKAFMNYQSVPNDKLLILIATHLTFVVSALLLAIMDRVTAVHR